MSSIEDLRNKLQEQQDVLKEQHSLVAEFDAILAEVPDDEESLKEKRDLLAMIKTSEESIASIKAEIARAETPKWDPAKHPKFRKVSDEPPPPPPEDSPVTFNVRDIVMAKWSGDKNFWEATIIDKTGSSADPVYTVRFKEDNSKETKRKFEIRPIAGKKRKADGDLPTNTVHASQPATGPALNNAVITAAPVIDTSLIVGKSEPSHVKDGPTRMKPEKKKLKGSKILEGKRDNWQKFKQTGPAGRSRQSQFSTPDAPTVSVVSSGRPMTQDAPRSRYRGNGALEGLEEDD